jgi:hypothetical protein
MWHYVEPILSGFRSCFSRSAAYHWFLIVIFGFVIRCDDHGVSSMMRWLFLDPQWYDPMLRFFRTTSWSLESVLAHWAQTAVTMYPLRIFNDRPLLLGDTTKAVKEGHRMPGVKTLHQNSENSGKAEFIRGHHFGFVGLVGGSAEKSVCIPLEGRFHEGVETECAPDSPTPTLITRMADLMILKARQLGRCCYGTADAFYSVGPMFLALKAALDPSSGRQLVQFVTRAKKNTVAYVASKDGTPKWSI